MFGHIDCAKCGHRHPETDDCQARKAERIANHNPKIIIIPPTTPEQAAHLKGLLGDFKQGEQK